ncbi:MAG: glycerol-3-phosphate 1-O-acyltransferase PlsY [Fimbriimonas sp.]
MTLFLLFLGAFLLGSIPIGFLAARAKGIDIRTVGSGNIGATNVSRALGNKAGYAVFVLDMLKGLIPGLVARQLITEPIGGLPPQLYWFLVGIAAFFGHMFCPWLGFKGGKGIATGLGALIAAAPLLALACFGVFFLFMIFTMMVSLSSLAAAVVLPIFGYLLPGEPRELVPIYICLSLLVFYKHRENIKRIRAGTEPKFQFKKKPQEQEA